MTDIFVKNGLRLFAKQAPFYFRKTDEMLRRAIVLKMLSDDVANGTRMCAYVRSLELHGMLLSRHWLTLAGREHGGIHGRLTSSTLSMISQNKLKMQPPIRASMPALPGFEESKGAVHVLQPPHTTCVAVDISNTYKHFVKGSKAWRLENADLPLRNLVRHALFADVHIQAVDRVSFYEWSGPIERSIVALHLGQLPVRGHDDLVFEVRKRADDRAPLTWVTSDDIFGDEGRIARQATPFLIAPLLAGQALHCMCSTRMSTGREHTRWNSVFPIVLHDDDTSDTNGCTMIVETTGSLSPEEAWTKAITTSANHFDAISKLGL